uniref:Transmembrane protein 126A n=1 Tax=Kryptolebias marmoratus TaxID=37003 RepID=A0A3Q2ZS07_KRYMA
VAPWNAGLAGLVSNSLFRRVLNVQAGRFASSLPMAVLPFLTTAALYHGAVSGPLLSGDLSCPSCTMIRGALIGLVGGGLYPILLALPVNLGLAAQYSSAPLPEKGSVLRFCADISRPVFMKMRPVFVLQTFFGGYLGSRHFESYIKLARITFGKEEELRE